MSRGRQAMNLMQGFMPKGAPSKGSIFSGGALVGLALLGFGVNESLFTGMNTMGDRFSAS